jgi:hypothetical protein
MPPLRAARPNHLRHVTLAQNKYPDNKDLYRSSSDCRLRHPGLIYRVFTG